MSFILLFQFLGTHIPELGVTLVLLFAFGLFGLLMYKKGYHDSGVRWKWEVEHMPRVIEQGIRERLERQIVKHAERIKWLEERHDAVVPALRGMASLAERAARDE